MSNLLALIANEHMKIYRRPHVWIMAGLVLAAVVTLALLMRSFGQSFGLSGPSFANSAISLTFLVFIFSVVIAADIVAGEFSWGTIKLLLIRPVSRSSILLSKYIAVMLFMLGLTALLFVSSLAIGFSLFGSGAGTGLLHDPNWLAHTLQQYGFRLVDIAMNVTFAFMVSTVFRSGALAISLSFIIMFASGSAMQALVFMEKEWAKYIVFANTDLSVYFGGNPPFPDMTLGFSLAVLLVYYAVFMGLSWTLFCKRDVAV